MNDNFTSSLVAYAQLKRTRCLKNIVFDDEEEAFTMILRMVSPTPIGCTPGSFYQVSETIPSGSTNTVHNIMK